MPGQLLVLTDKYRDEIVRERVEEKRTFRYDVDAARGSRPRRFVALLVLDGHRVTHTALATRGGRVATGTVRVRYGSARELTPVSVSAIELGIAPRFRHHFTSNRDRDGWLHEGTWKASLDFVRREARNDRIIRDLESQTSNTLPAFRSRQLEVVTEERDALGLALQIFDPQLSASVLSSIAPSLNSTSTPVAPFVMALQNSDLPEDLGIAHDARVFDGWVPNGVAVVGATTFERGDKALTVANVNRTRIENVLGVDLLYFPEEYRAFVFVQYKRMVRDDTKPASYRPVGASYKSEYERMLQWDRRTRATPTPSDLRSYRLGSDAFFFKLYANPIGAPTSDRLLRGMYFPLSYWTSLIASPEVRGPRGGVQITYDNTGRYLTNTDFVGRVGGGWIGSSQQSEKMINDVVAQALDARHSVTLATSQRAQGSSE